MSLWAAAADHALRLEQRTELNREYEHYQSQTSDFDDWSWRAVTIRDYGDGIVELGYSSVQYPTSSPSPKEKEPGSDELLDRRLRDMQNLERSLRRSRAQVRRKCLAGHLDHLLTLTYRENMGDVQVAYSDFKRFVRLVRKRYPGWRYLAVHELQKRGAVHFHCAVAGFQDVRFLRDCWVRVVGSGNIDVQVPGRKGRALWARAKLASYLVKYLTKENSVGSARQRYRVAQGIEIPEQTRVHRFPKWTDFVAEIFDSLGVPVTHHWKDPNGPNGWACSW